MPTPRDQEFLPCPFSGGADRLSSSGLRGLALFSANLSIALESPQWLSRLSHMGGVKQGFGVYEISGTAPLLSQPESRDGVER